MATYPVLDQSYDSAVNPIQSTTVDVAADGTVRGRNRFDETVYELSVLHPALTETEKDSILTFYETNKNLNFTFNLAADGDDYNLVFTGQPITNKPFHNYWNVTLNAIGTKL